MDDIHTYTTFEKGFIASTNIVVYKQLFRQNSRWFTLEEDLEVKLDSEVIPDESSPKITETHHNCMIEGGVIHSYTKTEDTLSYDDIFYFKAIIPKGARFWIQDDLKEIASEKLYLTSEMVTENLKTDFSSLFSEYCLDLLLNNGERVKWSSDVNPGDVKGIFVYDSQATSLEIYEGIFSATPLPNLPDKILKREEAEKDTKGRERTKYLRENYPDIEILKKSPEDSYIPSCGELTKALENLTLINLTRKALGLETIGYGWFWSSTTYSDEYIWYVNPLWNAWSIWRVLDGAGYYVLPFLDNRKDLP